MPARKHWFPKPYADLVSRLRVPAGFVMVAAFGYFSVPTRESLLLGIPISLGGLALRAWAAGHLRKNQKLATSGPYAFTRNTGFGACSVGDGRLRRAGRARRRKPQRSPSQLLRRSRARISLTASAAPLPRIVAAFLLPQAAPTRSTAL